MQGSGALNVLIVDDEVEIVQILEEIVKEAYQCDVQKAFNGLDAFLLCREKEFDLIVTDHKMPYMVGSALISAIRVKENLNRNTPILMVTGYINDASKQASWLTGVDFMTKPVRTKDFLVATNKLLS